MRELALVAALLVVSVVGHHGANQQATAWEDEDFFSHCPPSRCSEHGPEIRFPLQLNSSNTPSSCGLPCMKLACSGPDTILDSKYLGRPYKVTAIDYRRRSLTIIPLEDYPSTSSTAVVLVLLSMMAIALYLSLKTRYNEEINLKFEMFLKTYGASKPTRYSFSEVKKIARRFKNKLGQGGFGSVYKGELPNGVPVAVKLLENSGGEGDEFINEVATIGRIHHANIVRLVGFCSEGTRRALIYEFMPNESLEKYIFSHDSNTSQQLLVPNKMLDIALGIARGMEYLHQGCNQRILHFDIKPHNILLDYNFSPKISDFGLAKLCARDQSIVTLTAARGTMGYIAPELYSRNFGEISYKSDVYSFGMLVLEMVSGRRNSDPGVESQNEVYFPEWIYEQVATGQDLAVTMETTQEEKETVTQLTIVALWCIQWNPKNRPSMTKVVNMLTGRLQNLQSSFGHPCPIHEAKSGGNAVQFIVMDLYNVPRSFLQLGRNDLVVFDQFGGDSSKLSFTTRQRSICAHVSEMHPAQIDSWISPQQKMKRPGPALRLECFREGQIISNIKFASFRSPSGTCGNYNHGECSSSQALAIVQEVCVGVSSCNVPVSSKNFGDPCTGVTKSLVVEAVCS
ncbi:hypothetical protein GUJ93_ZPchr0013g37037 [Zizania palustris]|uniref:Protein kinase domain-containing protein n=1 Tax=Zizania palustris TaxID=103762 RepID=A0A8J5WVE5_ZIZPA|nr:hypothetical protein GUJ93_ZPchr0013g37037 [Zizania palustris]